MSEPSLFSNLVAESVRPLADRMRPRSLDEFLGQRHILGEEKPLRTAIASDRLHSMIFWGPPGTGKTTLARLIAHHSGAKFLSLSAVLAGVKDIRKAVEEARLTQQLEGRPTILFIDEVHRFNKSQQDAVLPHVENGTIRLIGSSTENPSFEVIPALRSRCQVFRLGYLTADHIRHILERALKDEVRGLGHLQLTFDEAALDLIVSHANGDARRALNVLEAAAAYQKEQYGEVSPPVGLSVIEGIIQRSAVLYDKDGTEHYDHASAFQKSMRGSDADAAIYWLAKMIAGGEDPKFIARRLVVTAAEDIGLADPMALVLANATADTVERIGFPEARIPLAQAVIYLARAPKNNTAIKAIDSALSDIEHKGQSFPVPDHLKDAHYKDAKKYGYGTDYKYPHNYPGHHVEQEYLPAELKGKKYVFEDDK